MASVITEKEIKNRYRGLLRSFHITPARKELKQVRKAYQLVTEECNGKLTFAGEPVIDHVTSVVKIVAGEMGLGYMSVIGTLLKDVINISKITENDLKKTFGFQISEIIKGLGKISDLDTEKTSYQPDHFRKLVVNLADDIRVILIKLAERLEVMRKLDAMDNESRLRVSSETYYLYAPLAHRLGLHNIKSEMEDTALKYLEPDIYNSIAEKVRETTSKRNRFTREFIRPLKEKLSEQSFNYEVKSRLKSIHSIWQKMKKQGVNFEEVYDIFAIRIILETREKKEKKDCWQAYSIVTDIYQPNPQRLRDWISIPKSNGYESLHTTVVGAKGRWVEVQIRTSRMNEIAEKGYAAHWQYKGGKGNGRLDSWLTRMREILDSQESTSLDFYEQIKSGLYSDEIYIFTPDGDLKQLPAGATVLDFAFEIHSEVGAACVAGNVNGKNVPIRHVLKNGDRVSVITSKNQKPKTDWLNFVITSKAKTKIKQTLNEEKLKAAESGKEILIRRLKNWKIRYSDQIVQKLLSNYKIKLAQDLYWMIQTEKIDISEIKEILSKPEKELLSSKEIVKNEPRKELPVVESFDDFLIIEDKVKGLDYKLAKCCMPVFGDKVFGFVTISEGIKIHRINCPNAPYLYKNFGYRIVKVRWTKPAGSESFLANIRISGVDEIGIINKITDVISNYVRVNMRSISVESKEGLFESNLKVLVSGNKVLEGLVRKLEKIKGVTKVSR
ncbi:MAG: bifunctional (p)ppGpp synthetase/guanosine-3',5'-bis(diphosphate) 3'-pyrophosphohydrolase [Bacteroidales bacterium]|nr:bifunctional (p)ppGpp synthetase/guanosine-3',5'-bis(diphosphate) 3'-pyrophosphohydrolase [Bacteroidales bacterium]